mmetsp:Transcript_41694/g.73215  ORF Transcript_41694/g.73215 Transcript_41694/m.73215 type:complete len:207 (+) Transcript_41694:2092-2712(+)
MAPRVLLASHVTFTEPRHTRVPQEKMHVYASPSIMRHTNFHQPITVMPACHVRKATSAWVCRKEFESRMASTCLCHWTLQRVPGNAGPNISALELQRSTFLCRRSVPRTRQARIARSAWRARTCPVLLVVVRNVKTEIQLCCLWHSLPYLLYVDSFTSCGTTAVTRSKPLKVFWPRSLWVSPLVSSSSWASLTIAGSIGLRSSRSC